MSIASIICFINILRILRRRRVFVVHQNPMRRTLHILKLPALDRPKENRGNRRDKYQTEGYQKVEDVH